MSCRPHGLAGKEPTGAVERSSHIGFAGDYTLQGDTLTTDMVSAQELNSDLSPSAKIVWLRDDSP